MNFWKKCFLHVIHLSFEKSSQDTWPYYTFHIVRSVCFWKRFNPYWNIYTIALTSLSSFCSRLFSMVYCTFVCDSLFIRVIWYSGSEMGSFNPYMEISFTMILKWVLLVFIWILFECEINSHLAKFVCYVWSQLPLINLLFSNK